MTAIRATTQPPPRNRPHATLPLICQMPPAALRARRDPAPRATALAAMEAAGSDAEFPRSGAVEFRDVVMAYRPGLPTTLRGVSFSVPSGSSVGIVGRTGAGKSSLIVSLFRLVRLDQPEGSEVIDTPERRETLAGVPPQNSGQILIGGVDIATVGLHRLRRGLSIIPQEPELFSGTVRSNVDPWGEFPDERIWSTLEACEMKEFVSTMEAPDGTRKGLETELAAAGGNLSVGQRQLLCLARAILRRAKVLVMDEATGSVDTLTDAVIQRTLSAQAKETGCTVLTIAHRINTIINNDIIIVMDDGKVAEMGTPADLLRKPKSIFLSLARAQGLA
jgi:ABC-type multidrug transport system fused ATPase/permease subunit